MAKLAHTLSGGAPIIKKFKAGTGFTATTQAGIGVIVSSTGVGGVLPCTTTSQTDTVGHSLDTTTYTTTQATTMVEGVVSVVVNPDGVFSYLMSGTAASGGALNLTTNSAASTGGTLITITTGDVAPNSPTMLDGVAYGISGNNMGLSRKITTVAATTATLLVPFPFTIAVGDTFILSPFNVGGLSSLGGTCGTLTTTLEQVRGDLASTTAATALRHLDVFVDYQGAPRTNSTLLAMANDHIYGQAT